MVDQSSLSLLRSFQGLLYAYPIIPAHFVRVRSLSATCTSSTRMQTLLHIPYEPSITSTNPIRNSDHSCTLHTTDASLSTIDASSTQYLHPHYQTTQQPVTMVKWEPTLNAYILAAALSVAEVTATNEMADAALAAWRKYFIFAFDSIPFCFILIHSIPCQSIPLHSLLPHLFGTPTRLLFLHAFLSSSHSHTSTRRNTTNLTFSKPQPPTWAKTPPCVPSQIKSES